MSSTHNKQTGITLVELLVAMVLSLVLMTGVVQIFVVNKQNYNLNDEIAHMQQGARFAANWLERDIRMAGWTGCSSRNPAGVLVNNTLNGPATAFTPERGVEGWEASSTGYGSYSIVANGSVTDASQSGWSTSTSDTPVLDSGTNSLTNSDIVRVWQVDGDPVVVNSISPGTAQTVINVPPNADIADDDILMISDCSSVDIVQACNVTTISGGASINAVTSAGCTPGNIVTKALVNTAGAHLVQLSGWIYYVGKRTTHADYPNNPPSLYRRKVGAQAAAETPEELVEGVESLQILYGEDTDTSDPDGVADRYVSADSVSDWGQVVSARIEILMQSERDDVVDGGQTFTFNGAQVTATDGRLRYPFTTTVALRNRIQ